MRVTRAYRLDALLGIVRSVANAQTLDHLHTAIEAEIAAGSQRIDDAQRRKDNFIDAVTDEECERIEDLLGLAFVAGQTFLTAVRTRIAALSEACKSELGGPLSFAIDPKAYDTFKVADLVQAHLRYTTIQVINAVANYRKHCENWPMCETRNGKRILTVWDTSLMRVNEKRTVDVLLGLGISPGSTGNLRLAAESLGVTTYKDLSPIREKLGRWANNLIREADQEISSRVR